MAMLCVRSIVFVRFSTEKAGFWKFRNRKVLSLALLQSRFNYDLQCFL